MAISGHCLRLDQTNSNQSQFSFQKFRNFFWFYFRWLDNSVIEIGKEASISLMFNHLNLSRDYWSKMTLSLRASVRYIFKLKFTELKTKMNVYELCLKGIMKQYIIRVHGKRILEPKRKFFLKYSAPFRRSTFVLIQCSTKDLYFTTNCILNTYRLTFKYLR